MPHVCRPNTLICKSRVGEKFVPHVFLLNRNYQMNKHLPPLCILVQSQFVTGNVGVMAWDIHLMTASLCWTALFSDAWNFAKSVIHTLEMFNHQVSESPWTAVSFVCLGNNGPESQLSGVLMPRYRFVWRRNWCLRVHFIHTILVGQLSHGVCNRLAS